MAEEHLRAALGEVRHALQIGSVSVDELLARIDSTESDLTYADAVAVAKRETSASSRATFKPHWERQMGSWGGRNIHAIDIEDMEEDAEAALTIALSRPTSIHGRGAHATALDAASKAFRAVERFTSGWNPAIRVKRYPRDECPRQALPEKTLHALLEAAEKCLDPELALLILHFLYETGARRGGAVSLCVERLFPQLGSVTLIEKGGRSRSVPVSKEWMQDAHRLVEKRSGGLADNTPVFLKLSGCGIDRNDFYELTLETREILSPTVPYGQVWTPHWIRYTLLHNIFRLTGELDLARDYAGHKPKEVIGTYCRLTDSEKLWIHDSLYPDFPAATGWIDPSPPFAVQPAMAQAKLTARFLLEEITSPEFLDKLAVRVRQLEINE